MDKQKILHEMYEQGKFDASANNYIENYKQGFKEGVQAVQIQLKEIAQKRYELYGMYLVDTDDIDEICKELREGNND